ncbi:uncharacterized protein BXZ73DRAFT_88198 [Epithele typhae]|uniref:uncharacterized protein n=1 Tax=Epithele typhae TaxID=378194 RepID=UPI00200747F2|nr:uncharacterized protein BXZ73DRAFT_88198 [Epithele typhae]KAH9941771.1 hypothetical protein BXZ73DRAFT_88198 [Epithele typhae]
MRFLRLLSVTLVLGLGAQAIPILSSCSHGAYSALISFGDSFTDNGNGAWVVSNHSWPANPNYFGGRFSNGPVWTEFIAGNLSIPLIDYAVGGATTSNSLVQGYTGPSSSIPVHSIDEQVHRFIASPPAALRDTESSRPLFTLLGGLNDFFFNPNVTGAQSAQKILATRALLAAVYPKARILVLDYPRATCFPYAAYVDDAGREALETFGKELRAHLLAAAVGAQPSGAGAFTFVDMEPLFEQFQPDGAPEVYGFTEDGAKGSCLTGAYGETPTVTLCDNAPERVWWDEYHPTTHSHSWVAALVLNALGV